MEIGLCSDCALSSHSLRYVMRNRKTDEPLLVIVFTLVPKEQVEKKGGEAVEDKKKTEEAPSAPSGDDDVD